MLLMLLMLLISLLLVVGWDSGISSMSTIPIGTPRCWQYGTRVVCAWCALSFVLDRLCVLRLIFIASASARGNAWLHMTTAALRLALVSTVRKRLAPIVVEARRCGAHAIISVHHAGLRATVWVRRPIVTRSSITIVAGDPLGTGRPNVSSIIPRALCLCVTAPRVKLTTLVGSAIAAQNGTIITIQFAILQVLRAAPVHVVFGSR